MPLEGMAAERCPSLLDGTHFRIYLIDGRDSSVGGSHGRCFIESEDFLTELHFFFPELS
jgi:hypothetical protein